MKKCWIAAGLAAAMMVTSLTGCGSSDGKKGCGERSGKRADRTVWRYGKV